MYYPIKKKLVLVIITIYFAFGISFYANAELSTDIPIDALSKKGKKVSICHYPSGNPDNYQIITIDRSALSTHIDHHQDVFASNGKCPILIKNTNSSSNTSTTLTTPTTVSTSNIASSGCAIPSGIINKVLKLLPEGKPIDVNSSLLTQDAQANILLKKDANIKVAFVYEGAGYTNTLNYFTFDKTKLNSLTTNLISEKVVFENFSKSGSGGKLLTGDTIDLGIIPQGNGVGFSIVSNGWDSSKNVLKSNRTVNQIFRTVKGLNPESIDSKKNHTVLLSDPASQVLVIAIEDLNREKSSYNDNNFATDDDFNDAVLAICVDPWDAIDGVTSLIDIDLGTSSPIVTPTTTVTPTQPETTTITTTPQPPQKIRGTTGQQSWSEIN